MTEPVNTIKIGGVEYQKNEVAFSNTATKDRTNSKGLWEQYQEHTVTLKDGTKIKYETQSDERKATIDIMDDGSVNFFGLKGAQIEGTNKNDNYRLHGCEKNKINVYGDSENSRLGHLFGAEWKEDKVSTYNRELSDGTKQYSKNNLLNCDKADSKTGLGFDHVNAR